MALFDFLKKKRKREKEEVRTDFKRKEEEEKKPEEKSGASGAISAESISGDFVLVRPHITERARGLSQEGQYTFVVEKHATKYQVKSSVEKLYKVNVKGVRIIQIHGKPRRRGLTMGTKKGYKKAVVALKKGESIDIF